MQDIHLKRELRRNRPIFDSSPQQVLPIIEPANERTFQGRARERLQDVVPLGPTR